MPSGLQPLSPGKMGCSDEGAVPSRDWDSRGPWGMESRGDGGSRLLSSLEADRL